MVIFLQSVLKCSFGNKTKLAQDLQESSLIYKIFGGKCRSQVHCMECDYKSNTFEPFLALSLDIHRNHGF